MHNTINWLSFEIIKTTAPLVACCFAFVALLILIKFITKMHRYNPLMYILSFVGTAVIYIAFIDLAGLSRYDYVFDGIVYYLGLLAEFISILLHQLVDGAELVLLNITSAIEIMRSFAALTTFVYSANLAPVIKTKIKLSTFVTLLKGIYFDASKFIDLAITSFASSFNVHKLNCVYSC